MCKNCDDDKDTNVVPASLPTIPESSTVPSTNTTQRTDAKKIFMPRACYDTTEHNFQDVEDSDDDDEMGEISQQDEYAMEVGKRLRFGFVNCGALCENGRGTICCRYFG